MPSISVLLHRLWHYLREICGENDYARCCAQASARGEEPPTPETFYLAELRRKYSNPTRCC
ncbi:MAG: putative selenoprotein [Acidobacteriia bacterium]|nr:putative selenoprotein [Terriglobia bacterium]